MNPLKFIHTLNETEPEMARREYITRNVLFFLFIVDFSFTLISFVLYLSGKMPLDTLIIYSITLIALFFAMFFTGKGYWRSVGIIPPVLMYFIAINANYIGGIDAPGNFLYALLIMFVAIIYGYRKMWIALIICLATYLYLAWMISIGHIIPYRTAETVFINRVVITSGSLVIIAFMIWILSRSYKNEIDVRIKAEETLRENENKYRLLADNVNDVIFVLDMNLNYTYVSPSIKILRGYEPEEVLKQSYIDILTPSSMDLAMNTLSDVMELEKIKHQEITESRTLQLEMRRKDGTTVWTEVKFSFIRDENQRPVGILGVSRDITERKRAEAKLQQTLDSLKNAVGTTIHVLVSAVEARDSYTSGHQLRSADLARAIATDMGLAQEKIDGIRMAGSIHDIGKLSIPAEILSKPTKLTEIEFSLIKEHARSGYEMLKNVQSPWPLAQIVYQHHERMDGSGYPRNLKGDEILMDARIMAVADVVEAMASHRPYRAALGIETALEEIEKNKGLLYDDAVADACLRLFREKGYQLP